MPESKPDPLTQEELEEKLESGESLEGVKVGDIDFSNHSFEKTPDFTGAVFIGETNLQKLNF